MSTLLPLLGLSGVPAASTLRGQLDALAEALMPRVDELPVGLLRRAKAPITPLACGWVPREGKRLWVWETAETSRREGHTLAFRRIHRLIERTIDRHGQGALLPELEYAFWDTTLPADFRPSAVIALYADHGTHEQFHSEFKTDLDLERLPSGKFATNDLILSLAMLAYNVLRLIGQGALLSDDAPVRHPAKRRRLKTVIQELITVSVKLVAHARQAFLNFGRHCPAFVVFHQLYDQWSTA